MYTQDTENDNAGKLANLGEVLKSGAKVAVPFLAQQVAAAFKKSGSGKTAVYQDDTYRADPETADTVFDAINAVAILARKVRTEKTSLRVADFTQAARGIKTLAAHIPGIAREYADTFYIKHDGQKDLPDHTDKLRAGKLHGISLKAPLFD
jgi:hypothetical protein